MLPHHSVHSHFETRQGHVWGVARMSPAGDKVKPLHNHEDTLSRVAPLILEEDEQAAHFKDPEGKDILVTGEEKKLLEAQRTVLEQAQKSGDQFVMATAQRNNQALKEAVSVNATFIDATMIEENPENFDKQQAPIPCLDKQVGEHAKHAKHGKHAHKAQHAEGAEAKHSQTLMGGLDASQMASIGSYYEFVSFSDFAPIGEEMPEARPVSQQEQASVKNKQAADEEEALTQEIEALVRESLGDDVDVETDIIYTNELIPIEQNRTYAERASGGWIRGNEKRNEGVYTEVHN